MVTITFRRALTAAALSSFSSVAVAQTYTYTEIVVPGSVQTNPVALTNDGTVLGVWYDNQSQIHGFTYQNGVVANLNVPKAIYTTPTGINEKGEIVGYYEVQGGEDQAFLYSHGHFKTVADPGAGNTTLLGISKSGLAIGTTYTGTTSAITYKDGVFTTISSQNNPFPAAVNASGEVVGNYTPSDGSTVTSWIYANGALTTIPAAAVYIQALAINHSGTVAGYMVNESYQSVGFLYRNGKVRTASVPNAAATYFQGINASGDVVGSYYDANYANKYAVVRSHGIYTTLNIPGGSNAEAIAINKTGTILGGYSDTNGVEQVFIAIPSH